jgi:hypothetical protein
LAWSTRRDLRLLGRTGFSREALSSHRNMEGAHTGPFPAEAGPTLRRAFALWDLRLLGRAGFSRETLSPHRNMEGAHTGPFPAEAGPTLRRAFAL